MTLSGAIHLASTRPAKELGGHARKRHILQALRAKAAELAQPVRVEILEEEPLPEGAMPQHADADPMQADDDDGEPMDTGPTPLPRAAAGRGAPRKQAGIGAPPQRFNLGPGAYTLMSPHARRQLEAETLRESRSNAAAAEDRRRYEADLYQRQLAKADKEKKEAEATAEARRKQEEEFHQLRMLREEEQRQREAKRAEEEAEDRKRRLAYEEEQRQHEAKTEVMRQAATATISENARLRLEVSAKKAAERKRKEDEAAAVVAAVEAARSRVEAMERMRLLQKWVRVYAVGLKLAGVQTELVELYVKYGDLKPGQDARDLVDALRPDARLPRDGAAAEEVVPRAPGMGDIRFLPLDSRAPGFGDYDWRAQHDPTKLFVILAEEEVPGKSRIVIWQLYNSTFCPSYTTEESFRPELDAIARGQAPQYWFNGFQYRLPLFPLGQKVVADHGCNAFNVQTVALMQMYGIDRVHQDIGVRQLPSSGRRPTLDMSEAGVKARRNQAQSWVRDILGKCHHCLKESVRAESSGDGYKKGECLNPPFAAYNEPNAF